MAVNRREFGRLALASAWMFSNGLSTLPYASAESISPITHAPNRSVIQGVQFGLQPFCYHDLPMTPQNRPILIRRLVQNGFGMVELHAVWVEPNFLGSGVSREEARNKLREWRLHTPPGYFRQIKAGFDRAGIAIFTYYVNVDWSYTDAEIDSLFMAAKTLGARGIIGSYGLDIAARLEPFPGKYGMFVGLHNHDNLSDPNAFSNEASFEKGLALSPHFMATLDVRHFVAGNGDPLDFLAKHHARTSSIHLGDRRRDNGGSTPFGQGDAPIIQILRTVHDNAWPIVVLLEFEQGTLLSGVEETQICFDYCKRALS